MNDPELLDEHEVYDWAVETVDGWTDYERRIVRLGLNSLLPEDGGLPHHAGTASHPNHWVIRDR